MNSRLKLALPLALVAGAALGAWQLRRTDVVVTAVTRGVALDAVYATGTVEADDRASVKARLGGSIAECLVREGDVVKKGDILARLDNPAVTFALQRGQTQLSAANHKPAFAVTPNRRARLAGQRHPRRDGVRQDGPGADEEARRQRLLHLNRPGPRHDPPVPARRAASRERGAAGRPAHQSRLERGPDRPEREGAGVQVSDTEVRAPLDGVVLRRHVEPGEVVAQNQALFEVGDTSRLVLRVAIDEADVGKVTTNPPSMAVASLVAFRDRAFQGRVTRHLPRRRPGHEVVRGVRRPWTIPRGAAQAG